MKLPFTQRVADKIVNWLTSKEGFIKGNTEHIGDYVQTEVTDAFGFRYEVRIKNTGRIDSDIKDFDKYENLKAQSMVNFISSVHICK